MDYVKLDIYLLLRIAVLKQLHICNKQLAKYPVIQETSLLIMFAPVNKFFFKIKACSINCANCTSTSNTSCTSCNLGFYLSGGSCLGKIYFI